MALTHTWLSADRFYILTRSGSGEQELTEALWPGPCASFGVHLWWVQMEKTTGREGVSARRVFGIKQRRARLPEDRRCSSDRFSSEGPGPGLDNNVLSTRLPKT
ncbi:hypothetical protein AMECASPLE_021229 [Ameca splendens]|uniref:Uncharacterized protein n=1 Tax=Ameca splendens TaxID=208324 RepID=A0ABV0YQE0_9TELE